MAKLECTFKSAVLGKEADVNIIIPNDISSARVLYLLHGLSDNHTNWSRNTSIERYALEHNYFVVMPDAGRSFYADMEYGLAYYTYITQELYDYIGKTFKVNQFRENTFIAGLSMGGYGAFKLTLKNPDKYCAAASFSGVLDVCSRFSGGDWGRDAYLICGGRDVRGSEEDLLYLLDKFSDGNLKKPRLYQSCGTEDFLYQDNQTFKSKVEAADFDYKYVDGPGGHSWDFWDMHIKYALEFFDEK